jgi:peptidoglycan/LPS O-acetylase OafA/YrhL
MVRSATTPPGRISSLDGWRAFAIAWVLASHASFADRFPSGLVEPWQLIFNGDLGVRVFFVLSGFLITTLLEREHASTGTIDLRAFFVRRALRIWPLAFAALFVLAVLQASGLVFETSENWLLSLTFLRSFGGAPVGPTAHYWSLSVEEQFYLVAPGWLLLSRGFSGRRRAMVTLGGVVALAVLTRLLGVVLFADQGLAGPRSIFRYCDSIALGVLTAFARRRIESWLDGRSTDAVVGLGVSSVALLEVAAWARAESSVITPSLQAAIIAVMMVATARPAPGMAFDALNSRAAALLGRLSFSLYVWHPFFLAGFMGSALRGLAPFDWKAWWVGAGVVAFAAHRLVEEPFLRLKEVWPAARPRRAA